MCYLVVNIKESFWLCYWKTPYFIELKVKWIDQTVKCGKWLCPKASRSVTLNSSYVTRANTTCSFMACEIIQKWQRWKLISFQCMSQSQSTINILPLKLSAVEKYWGNEIRLWECCPLMAVKSYLQGNKWVMILGFRVFMEEHDLAMTLEKWYTGLTVSDVQTTSSQRLNAETNMTYNVERGKSNWVSMLLIRSQIGLI